MEMDQVNRWNFRGGRQENERVGLPKPAQPKKLEPPKKKLPPPKVAGKRRGDMDDEIPF